MRSYVYWVNMDKDIVNLCKACALAPKSIPVKFNTLPKTDTLWGSRIHVDIPEPMNRAYYFIIMDSFSKWPGILKCKIPTTDTNFLHELFPRFGVVDCILPDTGNQFTSKE